MLFKDRVKDTTTTTGTGNLTLSGTAPTGFVNFNTAFGTGSGNTFQYVIDSLGGSEWEVGIGYLSASTTLVRSVILASSNSGSAVSFSAGTKNVRCTVAAAAMKQDVDALLSSTVIDTDVGTKQNIYTVPAGKTLVITKWIWRTPGQALNALADGVDFGTDASAGNLGNFDPWVGMTATTSVAQFIPGLIGLTTFTSGSTVAAGDTLGVAILDTSINSTVTVDLFGYLY